MIDGSFKGFTPPPHSNPFNQGEFEFSSTQNQNATRPPIILETISVAVQLIEIRKLCDEYNKKGFIAKLLSAPQIISKLTEMNNHLSDRILTVNRNTIKLHGGLEDLGYDHDQLRKDFFEAKNEKPKTEEIDPMIVDKLRSLEVENRQIKLMINNISQEAPKPNFIIIALGVIVLNALIAFGIANSIG